jgi:hypothetical protein
MKFFVPRTRNREEAELVWIEVRAWLSEIGLPTTRRRVAALVCAIGGVDHVLAVDRETPGGDIVAVILESSELDLVFVCTPRRGLGEGMPYPLALDEQWRVVDFE